MFQITSAPRQAASALTVLAAMGASGMVTEVASAAIVDPSQAARATSSTYAWMDANWKNWLAETGNTQLGGAAKGFVTYDTTSLFSADISSASMIINRVSASVGYGIPEGVPLHFALIVEPWSSTVAKSAANGQTNDPDGPNAGSAAGTEYISVAAPAPNAAGEMIFDITSIVEHWQANPGTYYGVRVYVGAGATRGGVYAPNDAQYSSGNTAHLDVSYAPIPEPTTLALLGTTGLLALRRRR